MKNIEAKLSSAPADKLKLAARLLACCGIALLLAASLVGPATAATYNVANAAALQMAVNNVNAGTGGDSIVLAPGVYLISSGLSIDQDVTIEGDASAPSVLDGGGIFTILNIRANNISIENITFQNAVTAISYEGSGVFVGTGVTITGSQNGFYPGDSGGTTYFTNSTVANNSGRGIEISCAELHLTNVTVADNGVGVYFGFPCGERMQITNSLIVANALDCGGGGSFLPVGDASFDSDGSCVAKGFAPGLTTVLSLPALGLGSLAANGGPTMTMAITAASAAANAGNNAVCPGVDQRGLVRNDGACDIGAYEYGAGPGGNTQPGGPVTVSPAPGVTVTFSTVTTAGDTTATTGGPQPPSGFRVDGVVYDISTTAVFAGTVQVCLPYSATTNPLPFIYHFENGAWVNKTTLVDNVNHIVCATVVSLSPFAVFMPIDVSGQLQQLQALINSFNLEKHATKKFTHRLDDARKAWAKQLKHHHLRHFCQEMAKFTKAVQKQSGKILNANEANQLITLAEGIASGAGCSLPLEQAKDS